jgi:hypothetical protein
MIVPDVGSSQIGLVCGCRIVPDKGFARSRDLDIAPPTECGAKKIA